MKNIIGEEFLLSRLRQQINYECNVTQLARKIGVNRSCLSSMLSGNRQLNNKVLNYLGYTWELTAKKLKKKCGRRCR